MRTYTPVMTKATQDEARAVVTDQELAEGVFRLGSRYYVRTPTYAYVGVLEAVTPMVYVFAVGSATVFDTGPFPAFFKGSGGDIQPHEGAFELLIDRAGAVLVRMS